MAAYKRTDWNDLLDAVNDVLQNPPDGCDPIDPIPHVEEKHRWSKDDIQEVRDKLIETCPEITFSDMPELWKQSTIDEINDALAEAWCDCEECFEADGVESKTFTGRFSDGSGTCNGQPQKFQSYSDLISAAEADLQAQMAAENITELTGEGTWDFFITSGSSGHRFRNGLSQSEWEELHSGTISPDGTFVGGERSGPCPVCILPFPHNVFACDDVHFVVQWRVLCTGD